MRACGGLSHHVPCGLQRRPEERSERSQSALACVAQPGAPRPSPQGSSAGSGRGVIRRCVGGECERKRVGCGMHDAVVWGGVVKLLGDGLGKPGRRCPAGLSQQPCVGRLLCRIRAAGGTALLSGLFLCGKFHPPAHSACPAWPTACSGGSPRPSAPAPPRGVPALPAQPHDQLQPRLCGGAQVRLFCGWVGGGLVGGSCRRSNMARAAGCGAPISNAMVLVIRRARDRQAHARHACTHRSKGFLCSVLPRVLESNPACPLHHLPA